MKKQTVETTPADNFELLAIMLVSHGSSGFHLLFKYPFASAISIDSCNSSVIQPTTIQFKSKKSAYSYMASENANWIVDKENTLISNGLLCGLDNDVLAELCSKDKLDISEISKDKREIKIDNVFFVSSQTVLKINIADNQTKFNVVFAARSPLPRPVIRCYQTLSLAIAKALLKEESNSGYLSVQSKILNDFICEHQNLSDQIKSNESGFAEALEKSSLAKEFKAIYENIKKNGVVNMTINNCTKLSFCLPHLAYRILEKTEQTQFVEVVFDAMKYLKPYFGFMLLSSRDHLLDSLPLNCNFYTHRLIEIYNPRFCLARYAAELDVPINEIYAIVDHLIYWAKIKIIYPITETNIYVIHPNAPIHVEGNELNDDFNKEFENSSFHLLISQFSLAKPLVEHLDPRQPKENHILLVDQLVWLLQRNVLLQLHHFVYLLPRKIEHQRLCEQNSKISDLSFDEENEIQHRNGAGVIGVGGLGGGAGSEHSNDTENTEQKDLSVVYDEYREIFTAFNVSEKDQQYIFKGFEQKSESDIKLFVQLMPYYNGLQNLEAIMYYEQLNRSELITFLDRFKDLLVVSFYEDPNPLIRINARSV